MIEVAEEKSNPSVKMGAFISCYSNPVLPEKKLELSPYNKPA
jgi:hypothetical protein